MFLLKTISVYWRKESEFYRVEQQLFSYFCTKKIHSRFKERLLGRLQSYGLALNSVCPDGGSLWRQSMGCVFNSEKDWWNVAVLETQYFATGCCKCFYNICQKLHATLAVTIGSAFQLYLRRYAFDIYLVSGVFVYVNCGINCTFKSSALQKEGTGFREHSIDGCLVQKLTKIGFEPVCCHIWVPKPFKQIEEKFPYCMVLFIADQYVVAARLCALGNSCKLIEA